MTVLTHLRFVDPPSVEAGDQEAMQSQLIYFNEV
jgi:hypothetical protein